MLGDFEGRSDVLHINTTDQQNGVFQFFAGNANVGYADIWVRSGQALYLAAINGSGLLGSVTSMTGSWERIFLDSGSDAFNEVTLYSYGGAADFYVAAAYADVREASPFAATPAVPEPATWAMMLLGFGAIGGALRGRQKVAARVRFA